jgi:hypothetical protein
MEKENAYKNFYEAIVAALDKPTEGYCNNCTCRVPCYNNESEYMSRIYKIVESFEKQIF